jgi:uncharacterized protein YndB with AHSA1/START domain
VTVLDDRIVQEVRIAAPRELVWTFFTDPDRLVEWKGREAVLDPQPGGVYRCAISDQATAVGEYVTVSPYDEIVFTWGWEGDDLLPPGASTVAVTLTEDEDGTLVHLEHTGLPHPRMAMHDDGWSRYLPDLVTAAEAAAR